MALATYAGLLHASFTCLCLALASFPPIADVGAVAFLVVLAFRSRTLWPLARRPILHVHAGSGQMVDMLLSSQSADHIAQQLLTLAHVLMQAKTITLLQVC